MFKLLYNVVERALNLNKGNFIEVKLPPSCCAELQLLNQQHLETIKQLQADLSQTQYIHGIQLFYSFHSNCQSGISTIAKLLLKRAKEISYEDWCIECRSLLRYLSCTNAKDAEKAKKILMPFDIRYQEARVLRKWWLSNPTVGLVG